MIPNHLHLNVRQNLRPTGIVLATLLGAAVCLCAFQPETPIVIGDGSLTMTSSVSWLTYGAGNSAKNHPHNTKQVASVAVSGSVFPASAIPFSGQKAEIIITYAGNFRIDVVTGNDGKNLSIATDYNSFHRGGNDNELAHNNAGGSITHVTVLKNGQPVPGFDKDASPHTKVTVTFDN